MLLKRRLPKFEEGELVTVHGRAAYRWYMSPGSNRGAIWVGGVGGGWDTPAVGLYPRLCEDFIVEGIHSLRIRFRDPTDLDQAVIDVRAGIAFYAKRGVDRLALIGHSFGGAVMIRAAVAEPAVRSVVTLATQSYGAESVTRLGPQRSILLIHGLDDHVLSWRSSAYVYDLATGPKRIRYVEDSGHALDEAAEEVQHLVHDWIAQALREERRQRLRNERS
jgi:pimeloyl-ACP methyl ester carboxylesterase